jgi:simple sugar transport system substrate-binding protein
VAGIGRALKSRPATKCRRGHQPAVDRRRPVTTARIDAIGFWDPAVAGAACNQIALMMKNGEKVGEGTDLGIKGYNKLKAVGNVLYGDAAVYVDKSNAAEYPF